MKLVFLGTSAAQPTENRGLSCICLERDGEIIMFDAGEATQISYMKSGLGWNKKMKIFVTHLHGDHCIGLLGLLQTMTMQHRTEPLEIYGPNGIEEFIAANIKILNFGLSFPVMITIVKEGRIFDSKIDSIFLDETKEKAEETYHSTAKQAAILNKNAKVKNLVLTHFSARYKDETRHLEEAKQIHDSVITARDFLEIEIK